MTLEEAKKIAGIIAEADGGCIYCVGCLCEGLNETFPEFHWEMKDWYEREQRIEVYLRESYEKEQVECESSFSNKQQGPKIYPYRSMLNSLAQGFYPRLVLLCGDYKFSETDSKIEVFQFVVPGGYLGYPITLKASGDRVFFDQCVIDDVVGTFCGAVCWNSAGLLFYIDFGRKATIDSGNTLTLIGQDTSMMD